MPTMTELRAEPMGALIDGEASPKPMTPPPW